jgi:peroxiredoxin
LSKAEKDGMVKLRKVTSEAVKKGYRVVGLTASGPEEQQRISEEFVLTFDFFFCDETALKTIVRSSPAILKLNRGTILQKLHWNDIEDLKL